MNKQGRQNNTVVFVVVVLLIFFLYIYIGGSAKTLIEHRTPADISESEEGTGLDLRFYDSEGNPIQIPEWFSTASVIPLGDFSVVSRPSAPSCTTVSQCSGFDTNPNIKCLDNRCVLGNIGSMDVGVNVQNPIDSEIAFLNVAPTIILPVELDSVFNKSLFGRLAPGQSKSWGTFSPIDVTIWEGTQQTLSVSVSGTNEFTGQVNTVSDSIVLNFDADPTGIFTVVVESPAP